ncbi:hypothetical protein M885DRAFT_566408 [Pelagophyceae sp. CCMP2097]|nr:hypothetical protein M885DRAFT_566408 [Pelagophyceae sp. CCMP2097]
MRKVRHLLKTGHLLDAVQKDGLTRITAILDAVPDDDATADDAPTDAPTADDDASTDEASASDSPTAAPTRRAASEPTQSAGLGAAGTSAVAAAAAAVALLYCLAHSRRRASISPKGARRWRSSVSISPSPANSFGSGKNSRGSGKAKHLGFFHRDMAHRQEGNLVIHFKPKTPQRRTTPSPRRVHAGADGDGSVVVFFGSPSPKRRSPKRPAAAARVHASASPRVHALASPAARVHAMASPRVHSLSSPGRIHFEPTAAWRSPRVHADRPAAPRRPPPILYETSPPTVRRRTPSSRTPLSCRTPTDRTPDKTPSGFPRHVIDFSL